MVNDFGSKKGPILNVYQGEIKFILCFVPKKKNPIFTIPNIMNTLDPFTIEFVCHDVGKTIVNKFNVY